MSSPISDRRERSNDGGTRDATDDQAIAQADPRSVAAGLGFDALDVREDDLLLLEGDLGTVPWIASRDLLQMVAEDLGAQACGYITLCHFGFEIVHDRNRTVSSAGGVGRDVGHMRASGTDRPPITVT